MTLQELNRYFDLNDKLAKANEMLERLQAAILPGGQVLTGMPHAPGVKDKVGDLAVEIVDLEARITYLKSEIKKQEDEISVFVATIEDDYTRMIFRLRFQRALLWEDVTAIIGGGNTVESVKSTCYRYLEKLQRDAP